MPVWTDTDTVLLMTGVTVDDAIINRAEFDIAMITGITLTNYDEELISEYDEEQLTYAATVQAAWLKSNDAGTYSNHDMTNSVGQDGVNNTINPTGMVLAPRARMFINNLSWVRPRQVRLGSVRKSFPRMSVNSTHGGGWLPYPRR